MAWSASKVFPSFIENALANAVAFDLSGTGIDTFKVALYTSSVTPDNTVSLANSAYNAGVWGTANEVYDGTEWDQAGEPLTGAALSTTSATVKWDGTDTPSGGSSFTTSSAAHGCLVYDDTLSDYGICFNYFGGPASVTDGTLTIVWSSNGIFTIAA